MVSGFMCAATDDEAMEKASGWTFFVFCLSHYGKHGIPAPGQGDMWEAYQEWRHTPKAQETLTSGLIGSPETIRQRLREFEATGVDQVILLNQAGRTTHADICASLEMFAREVMPEFHAREPQHQQWKARRAGRPRHPRGRARRALHPLRAPERGHRAADARASSRRAWPRRNGRHHLAAEQLDRPQRAPERKRAEEKPADEVVAAVCGQVALTSARTVAGEPTMAVSRSDRAVERFREATSAPSELPPEVGEALVPAPGTQARAAHRLGVGVGHADVALHADERRRRAVRRPHASK